MQPEPQPQDLLEEHIRPRKGGSCWIWILSAIHDITAMHQSLHSTDGRVDPHRAADLAIKLLSCGYARLPLDAIQQQQHHFEIAEYLVRLQNDQVNPMGIDWEHFY